MSTTLNAVEDEFSDVPNNPDSWRTDGRLYPPQLDRSYPVDGYPDIIKYRSFKHETYIAKNGAIEVRLIGSSEVGFAKVGSDGKGVWE